MISKLKYKLKELRYWKILFSPFKPFRIRFYAGKLAIGVPYFYPRKWRKLNEQEVIEKAKSMMEKQIKAVAVATDVPQLTLEQWIEKSRGYMTAVPIKVGFNSCGLGWKTKWTDTDFRHEYDPVLSFVFFGYQIAIQIKEPEFQCWEAWLYYEYATDKTKSKRERIAECRRDYPQTWTTHQGDTRVTIDYYNRILKRKYLK